MIEVPKETEPISFREHYGLLEEFVDECNRILRRRGFRLCEAHVQANWLGNAELHRHEMTDKQHPDGRPVIASNRAYLSLPWTVDDSGVDAETVLNYTLGEIEKVCAAQCSHVKVVRISFDRFARQLKPATDKAKNGRSLIVTP